MAFKCIDDCVNIKSDAVCVRTVTTYANLHKWPMAEAEFVRSISDGGSKRRTTVVDSISCRQMYLRSYTFTTKESEYDGSGGGGGGRESGDQRNGGGRKKAARRKSKTSSCRRFAFRLVWKCFSCASSTKVNIDP
ncbi:hypothetical protein EUTSA_v10002906mg [Eutrema salsugineum]|uniref:Uncharacterized protein n=1 Tax=Eutrema salsugineum TaxID=72664 RepID=V4LC53_EUTSA|nr:uncharacterized protein LOC18014081 [Eutrema salsugineum]ESQ37358.1 hypothetical protein EUTSA_v10002906mg [Eutrema salsugineum]